MIPEIDIWRAATLMLKRYGEKALEQSATRADELAAEGALRCFSWSRQNLKPHTGPYFPAPRRPLDR